MEMSNVQGDAVTLKEADEVEHKHGCCGYFLMIISVILAILLFPFSLFAIIKQVSQYQRAVILRLGILRDKKPVGPGIFTILPCTDTFINIDIRVLTFDVPSQSMLTRDSVTVNVDAVVFYRIVDPIHAAINIVDVHEATKQISQTTLRNVIGSSNLSDLLTHREEIAAKSKQILDNATEKWGVSIERLEIKDVGLPPDLQRSMAAEAEAQRNARAKIVLAEGEQMAAKALKEAADVIMQSPAAMQLKYLQTLTTISAENSSTVIVPIPVDLIQTIGSKAK